MPLVRAGATDREELAILAMWTARAAVMLNLCHWARRPEAGPCELAQDPYNDGLGVKTVERSLYDRLGGIDAITAVVRTVVDRQMKDDRINQKFARTNVDRLIKEFVDQICQATGGPCQYTGRNMTETHHNMGVTNGEFEAFVEDVVAVLNDFKVGKAEQDELLNILAPLRGEIVEVDSDQTGTPLPSAFTPAPPL
jgi:hemoglobin